MSVVYVALYNITTLWHTIGLMCVVMAYYGQKSRFADVPDLRFDQTMSRVLKHYIHTIWSCCVKRGSKEVHDCLVRSFFQPMQLDLQTLLLADPFIAAVVASSPSLVLTGDVWFCMGQGFFGLLCGTIQVAVPSMGSNREFKPLLPNCKAFPINRESQNTNCYQVLNQKTFVKIEAVLVA